MTVDRRTAHWHRHAAEMRSKGLVRRSLWAYPEDWPELTRYCEELRKKREAEQENPGR